MENDFESRSRRQTHRRKVYGFFENSELDVVAIDNLAVVQARSSSSTIESSSVTTSTEACSSTEWQTTQSLISSSKASQTEPSSLTSLPTTLATSTRSTVPTPSPNSKCPYQEDYSPCVCKKEEQGGNSDDAIYDVSCEGASLEEIIQVFNRTTPTDFNHFTVVTNETTIPNHLMQSSWAIEVALNCMNGELEQIEPDAFNSSRHSMVKLEMIDCSIGKVDFVFSFVMVFRNCSGLFSSWFSLPRLHYLTSLTLEGITESNETISFPSNLRKIVSFNVTNSDLNESTINSLMYWLASSFGGILGYVTLSGNQMHALPPLFANNSFPELIRLTVNNNPLQILESNTLIVTSYFTEANFENCELEVLRPRFISDSFNYYMQLRLGKNNLTRTESFTFGPIFQQLYVKTGSADFTGNPFDCTDDLCHLAWIIRDHPEYLGGTVKNAACANGTLFKRLDPNWFRNECP